MNSGLESIYGDAVPGLEATMTYLVDEINLLREDIKNETGIDPVEHCLYRLKDAESMREKCQRKGLPVTVESALEALYDAVGIRVVCGFVNDVFLFAKRLSELPGCEVVIEKDYIRHAKENGYRSLHLILKVNADVLDVVTSRKYYYAEIQLRTISMDTWASLEHHLRYKKKITGNEDLISAELKRCADELASTDISMQTIYDMIFDTFDKRIL